MITQKDEPASISFGVVARRVHSPFIARNGCYRADCEHSNRSGAIVWFTTDILGQYVAEKVDHNRRAQLHSQWPFLLSFMKPAEESGDWSKSAIPCLW